MTWKRFPYYWPFVRETMVFHLLLAWTSWWTNNRVAWETKRHNAYVMSFYQCKDTRSQNNHNLNDWSLRQNCDLTTTIKSTLTPYTFHFYIVMSAADSIKMCLWNKQKIYYFAEMRLVSRFNITDSNIQQYFFKLVTQFFTFLSNNGLVTYRFINITYGVFYMTT